MANARVVPAFEKFSTYIPWLICSMGMLYYCYNYFLRVFPSVMQHELMYTFNISAYQFGNLAAFYYYAYTPMQIPAGMLYDKFGARYVLFFACLVAVLGLSVFVNADNFAVAACGRFMIGLGAAFAYIGTLKLASMWLPENRFATAAGVTTACGILSAAASQHFLTKFVQEIGYQQALHAAVLIGGLLSLLLLFCVRNRRSPYLAHSHSPMNCQDLFGALKHVVTNPQMWIISLVSCLTYLPASAFLDLWGIPFLKTAYHFSPEQAAYVTSFAFLGWIIAGPLLGALSDKIKCRRQMIFIASLASSIFMAIICYNPNINIYLLSGIFCLLGISCAVHPLCFAMGKENNPLRISGTAVAVTNTLTMLGGALLQPLIGKLLDWHASVGSAHPEVLNYNSSDYVFALSVIPAGILCGSILCLFLRETKPK